MINVVVVVVDVIAAMCVCMCVYWGHQLGLNKEKLL